MMTYRELAERSGEQAIIEIRENHPSEAKLFAWDAVQFARRHLDDVRCCENCKFWCTDISDFGLPMCAIRLGAWRAVDFCNQFEENDE